MVYHKDASGAIYPKDPKPKNEWVEWKGGTPPKIPEAFVELRLANGKESVCPTVNVQWGLKGDDYSVIAYKRMFPIEPNTAPKQLIETNKNMEKPTAPDLLAKAAQHMKDRAATYDKPEGERSMGKTIQAFNAITGRDLSESEGWLLMQLLKNVRLFTRPGYHADSAEDNIAYAALLAESKARE